MSERKGKYLETVADRPVTVTFTRQEWARVALALKVAADNGYGVIYGRLFRRVEDLLRQDMVEYREELGDA